MRKYIGTSTISKKMKNRNRSRLRNEPMQPACRSSSHARYGFSSWCGSVANIASGNRIAVSTTSSSEMPSTPRCHEMPHRSIHVCFDTYWKPASPVLNDASNQMFIAPPSSEVFHKQFRPNLTAFACGNRGLGWAVGSQEASPDDEPREEEGDADADDAGVHPHEPALGPAEHARNDLHRLARAVDGAVDD